MPATSRVEQRALTLRSVLWTLAFGIASLAAFWLVTRPAVESGRFMPHGVCYTWNAHLIALHAVSDALIGIAYFSIPIAILYLTRKRTDLPFSWLFLLFGIFIVACGATHWMEVWTLWRPDYWLAGALKAITAATSVPTAVALVVLMPRALSLPSRTELELAKTRLEAEIATRRDAEAQLRAAQSELERRVEERTAALQRANDELERRESRLREEDAAKNRFLAVLAHELRNPLHSVRLSANIIAATSGVPATLSASAAVIERQSRQLARLLDDLLDVARITQDKLALRLESFDLREAVDGAIEACRPALEQKRQTLQTTLAADVVLNGDRARLTQVFTNVLANASKFTGIEGLIRLTLARDDGQAVVTITDTGEGIAAEDVSVVFDMFARGSNVAKEGLGVGLALARRLTEMHGGHITAASPGRGRGTTVTIVLPLAGDAGRAAKNGGAGSHSGMATTQPR